MASAHTVYADMSGESKGHNLVRNIVNMYICVWKLNIEILVVVSVQAGSHHKTTKNCSGVLCWAVAPCLHGCVKAKDFTLKKNNDQE